MLCQLGIQAAYQEGLFMHHNARGDLNQSAVCTRNVEAFLKTTAIAY